MRMCGMLLHRQRTLGGLGMGSHEMDINAIRVCAPAAPLVRRHYLRSYVLLNLVKVLVPLVQGSGL